MNYKEHLSRKSIPFQATLSYMRMPKEYNQCSWLLEVTEKTALVEKVSSFINSGMTNYILLCIVSINIFR